MLISLIRIRLTVKPHTSVTIKVNSSDLISLVPRNGAQFLAITQDNGPVVLFLCNCFKSLSAVLVPRGSPPMRISLAIKRSLSCHPSISIFSFPLRATVPRKGRRAVDPWDRAQRRRERNRLAGRFLFARLMSYHDGRGIN